MPKDYTYFLIRSLKKNDRKALEKLYTLYYSKLVNFAKKISSTTIEPEDFVHQTFLKLWEKRSQLNEEIPLDKQIFVICKNLILNQIKRDKKISYNDNLKVYEDFEHTNPDRSQKFKDDEIRELNIAITKLPEKRQEILILHKYENLTYEEIGQFLNISKKTIANQVYSALLFLKKELNKKNNEFQ